MGATRGIGRGIALSLARVGASVTVVGRSEKGGQEVVERMRALAPDPLRQSFRFQFADLVTVKGCEDFTAALRSARKGKQTFDFLVMTVGVWVSQSCTDRHSYKCIRKLAFSR